MNEKVSIIIPSFNYGHFLDETLFSICQMNYQNWEVLVIDDGSTDNTEQIVCKLARKDKRILYFKQNRQGVSKARNEGLKYASGKYIQFLDADDFLSEGKLKFQVEFMETNPDIDISYTDSHYFKSSNPNIWYPDFSLEGNVWMPVLCGDEQKTLKSLINSNFAVISSPLIKRVFLEKEGVCFDDESAHAEDWRFWCSCAFKSAKIVFFNHQRAYTLIRVHDQSASQQTDQMRFGELELRNWIKEQIQTLKISNNQRQILSKFNEIRKIELIRHMIFTGSIFEFEYIQKFSKYTDWKTVLVFYCKALNKKRKSLSLKLL